MSTVQVVASCKLAEARSAFSKTGVLFARHPIYKMCIGYLSRQLLPSRQCFPKRPHFAYGTSLAHSKKRRRCFIYTTEDFLAMAAPQCDSVAIENGGDDFIETPKVVNKVEAETRPDFKELKSIEKERREILLRVSAFDMQSCVSAFVDMHIFFSNQFHSFPLTSRQQSKLI